MKTISIVSQKGGAGKTTLALHLAVAAEHDGKKVVVVDLDPQASSAKWGDSREQDSPVIVSAQSARLGKILEVAEEQGAVLAILDTAPHSENSALAAVRCADLILIPCRPAILDLRAIGDTVDLIKLAKKSATVVLNAVPPRGVIAKEAQKAIAGYGMPMAPVSVGQRAAFSHALTEGKTAQEYEPTGKAAEEIKELYIWICKQLNM
jgi:chromosome partitioning protein